MNVKEQARKAQMLISLKASTNRLHVITPNSAILILQISEQYLIVVAFADSPPTSCKVRVRGAVLWENGCRDISILRTVDHTHKLELVVPIFRINLWEPARGAEVTFCACANPLTTS